MCKLRPWHAGVIVFALCLLLLLFRSYHPLYDAPQTNGDETCSLTQAMNSLRLGSPGYGWTAQLKPWTVRGFTVPLYLVVYGTLMLCVPPMRRLTAARVCSRVLAAAALFLCLVLLWRALRSREHRSWLDLAGVAAVAGGLVWLFAASENFLHVESFARVDALAVLAVCAFQVVAAGFLAQPTERRLIAVGLMVFVAISCSQLAGVLCASDAVVFGLSYLLAAPSRRRLVQVARAFALVIAVSLTVFVLVNFVLLQQTQQSIPHVAFGAEVAGVVWRATHLSGMKDLIPWLRSFPGVLATASFTVFGCLLLLRGSARPFALQLLRLAVLLLVAWVTFALRPVYAPFLLLAILLPFLDQLIRSGNPRLVRLLLLGGFPVLVLVSIAGPLPDRAADEQRQQMNAYRDAHIRAVFRVLDKDKATAALAADPMFTLLDSKRRRYFFLYEAYQAPEEEQRVVARYLQEFGIRHLVTTAFGSSGWVQDIGLPKVNQAIREHADDSAPFVVRFADGTGLRLQRRSVSAANGLGPLGEYQYADRPSTPITVYEIEPVR